MTIQELIDLRNIKALLAVFFNLTNDDDEYFFVKSEYRESTFASRDIDSFDQVELNNGLGLYFGLNFESPSFGRHILKIQKSAEVNTAEKFFKEIYRQIQLLSFEVNTEDYEEAILMSLFMLRGSADFSLQYYAVDIYRNYSSKEYLRYIFQIISGTTAISQLNLNFREFQPQFVAREASRNTQVRIKLGWFWDKFSTKIEQVNKYKFLILQDNVERISAPTLSIGNFSDRLVEYLNNVLGQEDNEADIHQERQRLGLETSETETRDYSIKTLANNILPDECMGCKDRFEKEARTFKLRERQKYYFEIHHIIPFSKGKEHDQIDNLAKLCPTCHRVLTKNRAEEILQKQTIKDILDNSDNAQKYVSILANSTNISDLVNFVYSKLV